MQKRSLILGMLVLLTVPTISASLDVHPSVTDFTEDKQTFSFVITGVDTSKTLYLIDEDRALDFDTTDISATDGTVSLTKDDTNRITVKDASNHDRFYINITAGSLATTDRPFALNVSDTNTDETELYLDDDGPSITDLAPENKTTNRTSFTVDLDATISDAGIGVDPDTITLTHENQSITPAWDGSNNQLTADNVSLNRGWNSITLEAQDKFNKTTTLTWDLHVAETPLIRSQSPTDLISDNQPTIQLNVADPAGINWDKSTLNIDGEKDVDHTFDRFSYEENAPDYEMAFATAAQQDDGTQTIEATIVSRSGDTQTHEWTYTVDATSPVIHETALRDGELHQDDIPAWIETTDAESGIESVTTIIDGTTYELLESDDDRYIEQIDSTTLADGEQTVEYHVEDKAGNEARTTDTIIIDNDAPSIDDTSIFPTPTTTTPNLTVEASDWATAITDVEYFIDDDPGTGNAHALSHDQTDENDATYSTTVPITDLDDGTIDIHVRAQDEAQHWSDDETITLELNRSLETGLRIEAPTRINITQGDETTMTVEVFNTGEIDEKPGLNAESTFETNTEPQSHIINPGTSRIYELNLLVGQNASLGNQEIDVNARSDASATAVTLPVTIRPDEATKEKLESRLAELKEQLEGIRAEREQWDLYLDDTYQQETDAKIEATEDEIASIESALQNGQYLALHRNQDDVETLVKQTDQAIDRGIDQYQESHWNRQILLLVLVLIGVGAVGIRYQYGEIETDQPTQTARAIETDDTDMADTARQIGTNVITNLQEQFDIYLARLQAVQGTHDDDDDNSWSGYEAA